MKAGSFWPSPSMVQQYSPEAPVTPVRTAALWPQLCAWRNTFRCGFSAIASRRMRGRLVVRTVIDIDDLEPVDLRAGCLDLRDQRQQVRRLVSDGTMTLRRGRE